MKPSAHPHLLAAPLLALGLLCSTGAQARQDPVPVENTVRSFLQTQTRGLPGKVQITVQAVDPANNLPPCTAMEAFLTAGARAWGQVNVGVRCNAPGPWTLYVAARVAVFGDYLVSAQPLRAGQVLGPQDVRQEFGDLTALPDQLLQDSSQAVGYNARFAVAAGQPLRSEMLRLPPAVLQGKEVKIITRGPGFQVSNQGVALNTAGEGQPVRVRLADGRVLSGTARLGGVVEIAF